MCRGEFKLMTCCFCAGCRKESSRAPAHREQTPPKKILLVRSCWFNQCFSTGGRTFFSSSSWRLDPNSFHETQICELIYKTTDSSSTFFFNHSSLIKNLNDKTELNKCLKYSSSLNFSPIKLKESNKVFFLLSVHQLLKIQLPSRCEFIPLSFLFLFLNKKSKYKESTMLLLNAGKHRNPQRWINQKKCSHLVWANKQILVMFLLFFIALEL